MSSPILVPTLGESVTEATVAKWLKKSGDKVNEDEPLVELETDKVSVEVTSPSSGFLSLITIKEGETVEVGAKLGEIGDSVAKTNQTSQKAKKEVKIQKMETLVENKKYDEQSKVVQLNVEKKTEPSPSAKRIIAENNIDITNIHGTGRRGQILKSDLIGLMGLSPAIDKRFQDKGPEERVRMSRLRATIAKRLKEAQNNAATLTTINEDDMSMIMQMRKDLMP